MATELILLDDVVKLGKLGETVRVANGYARNYLVPKGLAAPITQEALRRLEIKKREKEKQYAEELSAAKSLAERLSAESVTIPMEANEQDKLYGSVGPQKIAAALAEKDIEIDPNAVVINDPIRELGVSEVLLQLHPEVSTNLKVWVVRS